MSKRRLGIEIGHATIKIVEMLKGSKNTTITHKAILPTPKGAVWQGYIIDEDAIYILLSNVLHQYGFKAKKVDIVLSSGDIVLREVLVPCENERHLEEIIKYKIDYYLPISKKGWQVKYQITEWVNEVNAKKCLVLFIAIKEEVLEKYISLIHRLGLKVNRVSVASDVVAHVIDAQDEIVVDIGAAVTTFTLIKEGVAIWSKSVTYGGGAINDRIAQEFKEDDQEAVEQFKKRYAGIHIKEDVDKGEFYSQYISLLIKDQIDCYIIKELEALIEVYNRNYYPKKIKKIGVVGGVAILDGLVEYIESKVEVCTYKIDIPIQKFELCKQYFEEDNRYFAYLIGLMCS